MNIDNVILTSNNNPLYLDFWPIVSRIWCLKFKINPILYFFYKNGEKDLKIDDSNGEVRRIELIKNIPESIQVLWARYYMPSQEPFKTWIISDIDMLPMSNFYFIDQIKNIPDDHYIHINPCLKTYGLIPSCYHIAKGYTYKKYLELPNSWEESIRQVVNSGFGSTINNNKLWFADEQFATNKILKNKDDKFLFLERNGGQNGFRIDRINWNYDKDKIGKEYYYDCHSIRPYEENKFEILNLTKLILNSKFE
jgi:hypothetical protein